MSQTIRKTQTNMETSKHNFCILASIRLTKLYLFTQNTFQFGIETKVTPGSSSQKPIVKAKEGVGKESNQTYKLYCENFKENIPFS